jgi:hypothetical protein
LNFAAPEGSREEKPAANPICHKSFQLAGTDARAVMAAVGSTEAPRSRRDFRTINVWLPTQCPIDPSPFLRKDDAISSLPSGTSPNAWSTSKVSPEKRMTASDVVTDL